jgi:hypothetical protein
MSDERDDGRDEAREIERLAALFQADPGPSPSDLAEARLMLKRALSRERSGSGGGAPLLSLRRDAWIRLWAQAAGFALLIALLSPLLPRLAPKGTATATASLVASLAEDAQRLRARVEPWLPSLPRLPRFTMSALADGATGTMEPMDGRPRNPASALLDWIPALHSPDR